MILILSLLFLLFFFLLLFSVWLAWSFFLSFSWSRCDSSPFECGFEHSKFSRSSFSLRFFFVLILFLIFDMELSFFVQVPFLFSKSFSYFWNSLSYFLLFFLVVMGLLEEWREGVLNWR